MMKRALSIILPIIAIAILAVAGTWYFHHKELYPSTDDAYVQAHIINIAPRVNGKVDQVYVSENQKVSQGQLLFTIDKTPYQIAVDEAEAKLEQIRYQVQAAQMGVDSTYAKLNQSKAELTNTRLSSKRILSLAKSGYVSKSDADNAVKNLKVAEQAVSAARSQLKQALNQRGATGNNNAQLKEAESALAKAKLDLSYTTITAPSSGYIENFDLRPGAVLSAYQQAFALVDDKTFWIQANFKETQLERIKGDQQATITLDMYPKHVFHGKVSSLSASTSTSFSLLPPENASANWVKVTQRFPVRILVTDKFNRTYPLRMGASATVVVNTTH